MFIVIVYCRQQILQQYYRYLNLLKRTNNFCKDFGVYKNLTDNDFEDLAVIGWIFEVENIKIKVQEGKDGKEGKQSKEQVCLAPVIYSNIKQPFRNYQQPNSSINTIHSSSNAILKTPFSHSHNNTSSTQPQQPKRHHISQKPPSSSISYPLSDPKPTQQLQPHIKRPLLLIKSLYTKYFIKAFNQIIKQSKQFKKYFIHNQNHQAVGQMGHQVGQSGQMGHQIGHQVGQHNSNCSGNINNNNNHSQTLALTDIQWIYAFTGLKLAVEQGRFYYVITEKTKVVALDMKFYFNIIQNLQKSIGFPYSYFPLLLNPKELNSQTIEQGYPLTTLQTQASIVDKISFTGILKEFVIQQPNAFQNKKDKQIILTFYEDSINPLKQMLGIARVIIKLSFQENQQQLNNFFKIGFIYLVTNVTMSISDNINIVYKLKQKWHTHIFDLGIQKSSEINQTVIKQLPVIQMSCLKLANVNRNLLKIKVDLVRCQHLFGKVICTQCKMTINSDSFCNGLCGKNQGHLTLWAILLVSDESTYAEISLQTKQILQFFNFTQQHLQEIKQYVLAQNSRKMVKLFNFFIYFANKNSSEPLLAYQKHIAFNFITKTLVCIPRYNVNESFSQQLTQDQKIQFQQSLQTSKQYMKKNKVHFNGYVKRIDKNFRKAIPFLKVIQVFGRTEK